MRLEIVSFYINALKGMPCDRNMAVSLTGDESDDLQSYFTNFNSDMLKISQKLYILEVSLKAERLADELKLRQKEKDEMKRFESQIYQAYGLDKGNSGEKTKGAYEKAA
jgi:riboflavin synthase